MLSTTSSTWVRRLHPAEQAGVRLVCFPYAGGSAGYFHGMSARLSAQASAGSDPAVELLAVQYPGRQDRHGEPLVDDVQVLADRATEALLSWTDRPLALFGHSMGASLAFEVGRRLERAGVVPAALVVSARRAPTALRNESFHLADEAALVRELRTLGSTGLDLLDDPEIRELVLPVIRNDYRAAETYRYLPGTDVSCPVLALTGDQDPKATPAELARWEQHTTGPFELKVLAGGHFYLNVHQDTVVEAVVRQLGVR